MLYQLLLTFKFPFKCAKMLCVGPSDSGKTTWIVPIMAVLDEEDVATLTREQVFSAQMLKATTQLLFIDEWTPDKLQFDQCKVLFQGGKQTISKKNKLPDSFGYRSGVYITMNEVRKSHFCCLRLLYWSFFKKFWLYGYLFCLNF